MEMILEWAKVFPENADYGDPEAPVKSTAGSVARKGGQCIVNAYFTKEEDLQKLWDAGMDPKPMGHPRVLDGEYGIGKYIKLRRWIPDNIREFKNNSGGVNEVNFGGFPVIIDFRSPEDKKLWSFEEDGQLWNGTKAIVKFDMYSEGSGLRLEKIAVKELPEYEPQEQSEYADVWD